MIRKSVCFLVLLAMTAACLDEPDCFQLNNDIIGISFKKLEDNTADKLAVVGIGTLEPPLLFSGDTTVSRLNLPLNYFEDETTFFFETADTMHLLRLSYVSQAQFVSENCGEKFVLTRLRVVEHTFDSVRLVRDVPTQAGGVVHIEIFQ